MNKMELVTKVAEYATDKLGRKATKEETKHFINATFDAIQDALVEGEKVQISGFGAFEVTERAERIGRNPQTGEAMTIEAMKAPKFKAGSTLKSAVRGE